MRRQFGIDEIDVCRTAVQKGTTPIRDPESGAVPYAGDGKGSAAPDGALKM